MRHKKKTKKPLSERWQFWVTIIGGILGIVATLADLPEKISHLLKSPIKADSTQVSIEVKLQILEGQIVDEKGEPLPEVIVYLPDYDATDTTNAWGKYKFEIQAPLGARVKLQARKTGYDMLNQDPMLGGKPDTFQMHKL
ncbi:MAG: hypothetical protein ONB44_23550 [candidate division KSB1 bacterium]|nr:hypothetical protein [candidate division KSB1 bacterium]MDZ7305118.1 hypothetical protein [candidate division KSB1 bacterium]MDZ7314362.1 hypothetical protein [candidate division KSB1 bacterium]